MNSFLSIQEQFTSSAVACSALPTKQQCRRPRSARPPARHGPWLRPRRRGSSCGGSFRALLPLAPLAAGLAAGLAAAGRPSKAGEAVQDRGDGERYVVEVRSLRRAPPPPRPAGHRRRPPPPQQQNPRELALGALIQIHVFDPFPSLSPLSRSSL